MFSRGARTLAREFRDGEPPGPLWRSARQSPFVRNPLLPRFQLDESAVGEMAFFTFPAPRCVLAIVLPTTG